MCTGHYLRPHKEKKRKGIMFALPSIVLLATVAYSSVQGVIFNSVKGNKVQLANYDALHQQYTLKYGSSKPGQPPSVPNLYFTSNKAPGVISALPDKIWCLSPQTENSTAEQPVVLTKCASTPSM